MSNLAKAFKDEIARIARKQSRTEMEVLKRAIARHRSDIASLKRQIVALTRQLANAGKRHAAVAEPAPPPGALRFRPKGLASHRKRLGLSAAEIRLLLGVSGQSVYLWEAGRARPSAQHMPAIAALRRLGRRQAAAVVASRR
jgi:DNA-binding transcriptional regulator YiaG